MNDLVIAPENLEVANVFLQTGSYDQVSKELGIPRHEVVNIMKTPEVKRYIDAIYYDTGYRNRHRIAQLMDEMIEKKLEEMEMDEVTSSKDILDMLQMMHKMTMDHRAHDLKEAEKFGKPINPNVYNIGDSAIEKSGGANYSSLMEKLVNGQRDS